MSKERRLTKLERQSLNDEYREWTRVFLSRSEGVPEYGYPSLVNDPRDFKPDPECSTDRNIRDWIEACKQADAGEAVDLSGNQHINAAGFHLARTAWGLGSYWYRESEGQ